MARPEKEQESGRMISELEHQIIWAVCGALGLILLIVYTWSVKTDFGGNIVALDFTWIKKDWFWLVFQKRDGEKDEKT